MLQQTAQIRMMDALSCRSALEKIHEGLVAKERFGEGAEMGIFHSPEDRYHFLSHHFGIELALGQEIFSRYFLLLHATNVLDADLELSLVESGVTAHPHEVVLFEYLSQLFCALPDPAFDLAAPVHELYSKIAIPSLGDSMILGCHQEDRIYRLILTDVSNKESFHGSPDSYPTYRSDCAKS